MFGLDFTVLERERREVVTTTLEADDELWGDMGVALATPVQAQAEGRLMPSGQILVDGRLEGALDGECRRCLNPLVVPFSVAFTVVFAAAEGTEADDEDGEIRVIAADAAALDLRPLVREELLLNLPAYALCREDCAGLCPACGINLNSETCDCAASDRDPRWDALRTVTP